MYQNGETVVVTVFRTDNTDEDTVRDIQEHGPQFQVTKYQNPELDENQVIASSLRDGWLGILHAKDVRMETQYNRQAFEPAPLPDEEPARPDPIPDITGQALITGKPTPGLTEPLVNETGEEPAQPGYLMNPSN